MRNPNIDFLRLTAALGVITLHVGNYPELPPFGGEAIGALFRWCVPAFFMITGYLLADTDSMFPKVTLGHITKATLIFCTASIVFLPVFMAEKGIGGLSLALFVSGTSFHLWYLSALVIALVAVQGLRTIARPRATLVACAIYLLVFVAINYYAAMTGKGQQHLAFFRELLGIPCFLIGGFIRKETEVRKVHFYYILAVGVAVTLLEVLALQWFSHSSRDSQFLIGTLPMAVGLLGIAVRATADAPKKLAMRGEKDSLGIYIYHPLVIVTISSLFAGRFTSDPAGIPGTGLWIATLLITLAALEVLKLFPRLRSLADGNYSANR